MVFLFLILLLNIVVYAQKPTSDSFTRANMECHTAKDSIPANRVYQKMLRQEWVPLLPDQKTILTPYEGIEILKKAMGYNDTLVSNLKKIGVELQPGKRWDPSDIKTLTAVSDCIVVGTVISKEYPLRTRAQFNTIAYVRPDEYLRNDYNLTGEPIHIMIASGPLNSGEKMISEGEDTLFIGERALFFLTASGLIEYADNNRMNDLYEELINNPVIRFKIISKYELKDAKVFNRDVHIDMTDVRRDINTVINVLH